MKDKNILSSALVVVNVVVFLFIGLSFYSGNVGVLEASVKTEKNQTLKPRENVSIKISDEYSFKYSFVEKPKIGLSVLKVTAFDKNGKQVDNLDFYASYDMPSMRGHHAFLNQVFQKNKNGYYLLPINFVMRGEWEITIVANLSEGNDKEVYSETFRITI
jgi:hypothetical protein